MLGSSQPVIVIVGLAGKRPCCVYMILYLSTHAFMIRKVQITQFDLNHPQGSGYYPER